MLMVHSMYPSETAKAQEEAMASSPALGERVKAAGADSQAAAPQLARNLQPQQAAAGDSCGVSAASARDQGGGLG